MDIDDIDVQGWAAFKGHHLPTDIARHIADSIAAHRRASQAAPAPSDRAISKEWAERMLPLDEGVTPSAGAPAPSDGLREAWEAGRDAAAQCAFMSNVEEQGNHGLFLAISALSPPAVLSPPPRKAKV